MAGQKAYRAGMEFLHRRLVEKMRPDLDVLVEETTIGGVRVEVVTPAHGVRNSERVLINLHGGAFVGGAEYCGLVESIPIAATGRCTVISIDCRQGWEHRFPAASEDVAAVYEAVLADHRPHSVGIFGYSAGASLTAQAVSWFLANGLPLPGAVAMCSGGAGTTFAGVTVPTSGPSPWVMRRRRSKPKMTNGLPGSDTWLESTRGIHWSHPVSIPKCSRTSHRASWSRARGVSISRVRSPPIADYLPPMSRASSMSGRDCGTASVPPRHA
jgi:acetyl esterase/lipase